MSLLNPTSIALIGASENPKKLGNIVLRNLTEHGFKGMVYPVNPKHKELHDLPCYPSVKSIKGHIDLAVVATPAETILGIAEECGKKGVKTLLVISAGFSELGSSEGRAREQALLELAEKHDMKLIGPNCLGVLRPSIGLNASFAATPVRSGNIALISQSGALAVALLDQAEDLGIGFSLVVSIGNKVHQTESDFLELCADDTETAVIGLYLESITQGERFVEIARTLSTKKPIVLLKSGVSVRGARAIRSHTGALAGSSAALDTACLAAGIHRARTMEECTMLLQTLSMQPPLLSKSIAIVTNAGGPGVLATDAADTSGLTLAALDARTVDTLKKVLPVAASTMNPIDVLGDALDDRYAAALEAAADDPGVDGVVALLTPQVMTPVNAIAHAIIKVKKTRSLLPMTAAFMGGDLVREARSTLLNAGIPPFEHPEQAVSALSHLISVTPRAPVKTEDRDDDRSSGANGLLKGKRGLLSAEIVSDLFSFYSLPLPKQAVARSEGEAMELAEDIGFPVILKVSSPDILHKTDVGGVRSNLRNREAVKKAYGEILNNVATALPSAAISGVLVQKFLPVGNEFIIGGLHDDSFGPLVMVGLGGIFAELFRDTCFALAPVSLEEAFEMLSKLKAWKLLLGMRGKAPLNIDGLAETVRLVSLVMADCPRIRELDLNPVLVGEHSIVVADAKVVMEEREHL